MKIYTRGGDGGETSLFGGGRVPKDHVRVDAYGSVDELNATIGWARSQVTDEATRTELGRVQSDLFAIGAQLATPPAREGRSRPEVPGLAPGRTAELEACIDRSEARLPKLGAFVLPGGTAGAAALHLARTVCRRAERAIVTLSASEPFDDEILAYVNRLSDLLFSLARLENLLAGRGDEEWVHE